MHPVRVVRALELRLKVCRFHPWPFRIQVTTLGKLFTRMCKYGIVVKGRRCLAAGKVTVGLASHWPCITDFSGLSSYGLTA